MPKSVLGSIYGILLIQKDVEEQSENVDYSTLLSAYAGKKSIGFYILHANFLVARGFRTSNYGNPDESRAARIVLKDFVSVTFIQSYVAVETN